MLLLHLSIALSSIIAMSAALITPRRSLLKVSYSLVLLTIVSGTILVVKTHSPMLQSCTAGLAYIGASLVAIIAAQHRLANNHQEDKD